MIEKTIKKLIELKKTISTMESCSGGALANAITNIPDSSKIFSFGAVTYSNEYKIKRSIVGSCWEIPFKEKSKISQMILKANIYEL